MEKEILELLKHMQGDLSEIKTNISNMDDSITKIDDKVTKLDDKVANLDDKVAKLDDKVAKLDERVSGLDGRMSNIEGKISILEAGQIRIEKKLDGVVEQTADLTEFRTSVIARLDLLNEVEEVTKINCYEIAKLKTKKQTM